MKVKLLKKLHKLFYIEKRGSEYRFFNYPEDKYSAWYNNQIKFQSDYNRCLLKYAREKYKKAKQVFTK